VRFVLVGGFNTAMGYGLFVAFELLIGRHIGYLVSLYGSTLVATIVAFFLHRYYTYKIVGRGHIVKDFLRFETVYLASLLVNTAALPLLVEVFGVPVLIAQALIVVITTTVSYFGHRFFSFRRAPVRPTPADDPTAAS
jgi:putative flippase GtrA